MNKHITAAELIDMLREENRQLRDQIAKITGGDELLAVKRAFRCSFLQAKVIAYFIHRGEARRDILLDHCYPRDAQLHYDGIELALACLIKHVRKRLKKHGLELTTHYSLGWSMSDEHRRQAKQVVAGTASQYFDRKLSEARA